MGKARKTKTEKKIDKRKAEIGKEELRKEGEISMWKQ